MSNASLFTSFPFSIRIDFYFVHSRYPGFFIATFMSVFHQWGLRCFFSFYKYSDNHQELFCLKTLTRTVQLQGYNLSPNPNFTKTLFFWGWPPVFKIWSLKSHLTDVRLYGIPSNADQKGFYFSSALIRDVISALIRCQSLVWSLPSLFHSWLWPALNLSSDSTVVGFFRFTLTYLSSSSVKHVAIFRRLLRLWSPV